MIKYSDLGEFQPFAVSDRFNLPMSLAESFKKLICGGECDRLKTVVKDYKEAVFGIDYALNNLSKFYLTKSADYIAIADAMDFYFSIFTNPNVDAFEAARHILFFAKTSDIKHLILAKTLANKALEYESKEAVKVIYAN